MHSDETKDDLHVTDLAFDYLEGRLSRNLRQRIDDHLEICLDCAEVFATAQALQQDVETAGARHLSVERLLALADAGIAMARTDEQGHLSNCGICQTELIWLQTIPPPDELTGELDLRADRVEPPNAAIAPVLSPPLPTASTARRFPSLAPLAGTLRSIAAGIAALPDVLFARRIGGTARLERLAVIAPIPVDAPRGSASTRFMQGLALYAAGQYEAAVDAFDKFAASDPAHSGVSLFLGSALLLLHRPDAAIEALRHGLSRAQDRSQHSEYAWQLANAYVAAGRGQDAIAVLSELAGSAPPYDQRAADLLKKVRKRTRPAGR